MKVLKEKATETHKLWVDLGKPRSDPIFWRKTEQNTVIGGKFKKKGK